MAELFPEAFRRGDDGARFHAIEGQAGLYRSVDVAGTWRLATPADRHPVPVDVEALASERVRIAKLRADGPGRS